MGYILLHSNIWVLEMMGIGNTQILVDKGTQHFILLYHHFALFLTFLTHALF